RDVCCLAPTSSALGTELARIQEFDALRSARLSRVRGRLYHLASGSIDAGRNGVQRRDRFVRRCGSSFRSDHLRLGCVGRRPDAGVGPPPGREQGGLAPNRTVPPAVFTHLPVPIPLLVAGPPNPQSPLRRRLVAADGPV